MVDPRTLQAIIRVMAGFLTDRADIFTDIDDEFGRPGSGRRTPVGTAIPCRVIGARVSGSASQELGVTDTDITEAKIIFKRDVVIPPDALITIGGNSYRVTDVNNLFTDRTHVIVGCERLRLQ